MTAPDTNIEKQAKRHRPSLWGIGAAIVFVGALVIVGGMWLAQDPEVVDTGTIPATTATDQ